MQRRGNYARLGPLGLSCVLAMTGSVLAADGGEAQPFTYHEPKVLGTTLDLQVVAGAQADADKVHKAVLDEIERLRAMLSTYDATTDLGKVNGTRDAVKVAPEVIDLLMQYDHWQQVSKNAFSGRMGGLVDLWKRAAKNGTMPTREAVLKAVASVCAPLWKIDEAAGTVQRVGEGTINIDSLGKGFVISRAVERAGKAVPGVQGMMLNVGGDIVAMGSSSAAKKVPWRIGVADPAHPADNAPPLTTLMLSGMSVATSGSYERKYDVAGKKLSHLLDPRDGYPIDSADAPGGLRDPLILSATVIAPDNAVANALAASLCVLTPNEGMYLVSDVPGAEALIVMANGAKMRSEDFHRYETFAKAADGKEWPGGAALTLAIPVAVNGRERPYLAVWVEDMQGKHVATIAEWGNGRWMNSLSTWYRLTWDDPRLVAVSRATRPEGRYLLAWDGKDQKGNRVKPGTYKINVEYSYEHNGHSVSSGTIVCGGDPCDATIPASRHHGEISLSFGVAGN